MANPFEVSVVNPTQALLLGQQAYDSGLKRQKEQAVTDARGQAVQAYQSGDPKAALATLLGVGDYQGANAIGTQIQNDFTRKHTEQQDALNAQHWNASFGLQKQAADRAAAAESRAAADYENTPDQYAPNPRAGQPGQPAYIDQYAAAKAAGEAAAPGGIKSLTPGGELYHLDEAGKVVVDHKNDKAASADDTPQSTIDFLADRTRLGDQKHLVGLSRVPGLIARVQTTADQREAAGIPVSDQAKSVVNNATGLGARRAAENNLAGINNKNEVFGNNALGALDIAVQASADVPRSQYPSVNAALNAYRTGTGDPKTVALGAALNTVVNDYARFAGGGIGSDALRGEAERILNQAHNHEQVVAIANMMRKEILRGQQSPGMVRSQYDTLYGPQGSGSKPQGGNKPIPVQTPQQAMSLPPGTAIILPDGSPGVVPPR